MSQQSLDFEGTVDIVLDALAEWTEQRWIRRLDAAMARFVLELCPHADGSVLLAAALVAHMEGRGHTCLVLDEFLASPNGLLGWNAEASDALRVVMAKLPQATAAWFAALRACDAVYREGHGEDRRGPLVLSGNSLYLRRYWVYERRVAAQVLLRGSSVEPVDERDARVWLDRLFPRNADGRFDWQKVACAIALRGRLSVITGGPGTGKTYAAARLLALLFATSPQPERLRVALAAPTGKAAARLKQSIQGALHDLEQKLGPSLQLRLPLRDLASHVGAARTLHSLLGARPDTRRFKHNAANPLDVDVVIVDEASMVHLEMMAALLDALPAEARVVLLGDKDQLASVEAGAVLGDLCRDAQAGRYVGETVRYVEAVTGQRIPEDFADETGPALAQQTVMLRHSQRFGGVINDLALAVNAGNAGAAMALLDAEASGPVRWMASASPASVVDLAVEGRKGAVGGYRAYLETIQQRPQDPTPEIQQDWVRAVLKAFDRFRVLCAVREGEWGVSGLNRTIEDRLAEEHLLSSRGEWYEGRPVMVTRNDYGLGVFNGDIGIALKSSPKDATLRAYFVEGQAVRSVSVSRLADVETAFAMTVHKSQGSEFDHTVLVLPSETSRVTTRELIYTGITRARSALTLVSARRESLTDGIAQTTRRSSGLLEFMRGCWVGPNAQVGRAPIDH